MRSFRRAAEPGIIKGDLHVSPGIHSYRGTEVVCRTRVVVDFDEFPLLSSIFRPSKADVYSVSSVGEYGVHTRFVLWIGRQR